MKVVLFGATGHGRAGASLGEWSARPGRRGTFSRLSETPAFRRMTNFAKSYIRTLSDLSAIEDRLGGYDACFFSLGCLGKWG